MDDRNMDFEMFFLLLYVLETKYRRVFEELGNYEFLMVLTEMIDEMAFDRVGDIYATDAERALQVSRAHEVSLIDASDYAEDVIRVVPPERPSVGRAHQVLGFVRMKQGDTEAGKKHFEKAIAIFEKRRMRSHLKELSDALKSMEDATDDLAPVYLQILNLCQEAMGITQDGTS